LPSNEKDGTYCSICGGIPPDRIKTRRILIEGKETGIENLDAVLEHVRHLRLMDDRAIAQELVRGVKQFNYVPTKKTSQYAETLLREYKQQVAN
jgi:hypothetical protein